MQEEEEEEELFASTCAIIVMLGQTLWSDKSWLRRRGWENVQSDIPSRLEALAQLFIEDEDPQKDLENMGLLGCLPVVNVVVGDGEAWPGLENLPQLVMDETEELRPLCEQPVGLCDYVEQVLVPCGTRSLVVCGAMFSNYVARMAMSLHQHYGAANNVKKNKPALEILVDLSLCGDLLPLRRLRCEECLTKWQRKGFPMDMECSHDPIREEDLVFSSQEQQTLRQLELHGVKCVKRCNWSSQCHWSSNSGRRPKSVNEDGLLERIEVREMMYIDEETRRVHESEKFRRQRRMEEAILKERVSMAREDKFAHAIRGRQQVETHIMQHEPLWKADIEATRHEQVVIQLVMDEVLFFVENTLEQEAVLTKIALTDNLLYESD